MQIIRTFCRSLAVATLLFTLIPQTARAADAAARPPVKLNWLEPAAGGTAAPAAVSWGVPWPRGAVQKTDAFTLKSAANPSLPVQAWPLAYWPDGSIKWTGFATATAAAGPFELSVGPPPASPGAAPPLFVTDTPQAISIDANGLKAVIPHAGEILISSLSIDNRPIATNGKLTCILQDGPEDTPELTTRKTRFTSNISRVTLEQSGPVRAVVKIEGAHKSAASPGSPASECLPFMIRLYFYNGSNSIRMVHTFIYDGDQQKDFIKGLGIIFSVPFREEVQNRHVRFSNSSGGLWAEPIQPMIGRGGRFVAGLNGGDAYVDQVEGRRVPNKAQARPGQGSTGNANNLLDQWAIWDDFKLVQPNAEGFSIIKRTNPQSAWLKSLEGNRASGLAFVGDVTGGLAVTLRNFWQSYPASLEIRHAAADAAEMNIWLWSPDVPAMDMRHYDTRAHGLEASYEDVQPGLSTATGVARTSELTITATPDVPTKQLTAQYAALGNNPPLLVASPEYLHSTGVFGQWSVKDTSTPFKASVEANLDAALNFYKLAVEQGKWYGFWYFGNVMHSYDPQRHVWRYDLGGMAWDNSELGTDMWLWYSFLRSGRADIYRMAEAMTRNTGEIATYHSGPLKGLGTRHGVIPWGDGAKEARIGQAAYRRFYYYLSTDERTGDLMRESLEADFSAVNADPMRIADPPTAADKAFPTRVRSGPDWIAFAGNWMTEWERTGDTKWRDKIITGAKSMAAMPYGFRTGTGIVMGYDPKTGQLFQRNNTIGNANLSMLMGGAEVGMELDGLLDDPSWRKIWRQYCRLYNAPADIVARDMQTGNEDPAGQYATNPRLGAYIASLTKNQALAQRLIPNIGRGANFNPRPISGPEALNPLQEVDAGTNGVNEQSLITIALLELLKDHLPTEAPATGGRGRGGAGSARGGGARGAAPATSPPSPSLP